MVCFSNHALRFICGCYLALSFFFFFQAEDGIRDHCVTGVQTCALPIRARWSASDLQPVARAQVFFRAGFELDKSGPTRSEERRVGKECRSRGSTYHYKKKEERDKKKSNVEIETK